MPTHQNVPSTTTITTTTTTTTQQHSNKKNEHFKKSSLVQISAASMVVEKQWLELCAVHTVNNLLQLSFHVDKHDNGGDGEVMDVLFLCDGDLYQTHGHAIKVATKNEFDGIADEIACREYQLTHQHQDGNDEIHGESDDEAAEKGMMVHQPQLSMLQVLGSNHRRPVFGYYSFEVLEVALKRRGVELNWFNLKDKKDMSKANENECNLEALSCTASDNSREQKKVIGYVVNVNTRSKRNNKSGFSLSGYLNALPLVNRGQHWFAITRLRRAVYSNRGLNRSAKENRNKYVIKNDDCDMNGNKKWYVLDSKKNDYNHNQHILGIDSDEELVNFLTAISEDGGTVFQAVASMKNINL